MTNTNTAETCPGSGQWADSYSQASGYSCPVCKATGLDAFGRDQVLAQHCRPVVTRTPYGQKGGQGPNTGRKRHTYKFTLADGTQGTKASFTRAQPELWAVVVDGRATLWDDRSIGEGTVPRGVAFQTVRAYLVEG